MRGGANLVDSWLGGSLIETLWELFLWRLTLIILMHMYVHNCDDPVIACLIDIEYKYYEILNLAPWSSQK